MSSKFVKAGAFSRVRDCLQAVMMWKRELRIYLVVMLFSLGAAGQTVVTGVIRNSRDEGIAGVNVLMKGTSAGAISDSAGKYSIAVPAKNGVLVFSYVGMQTVEVRIAGKKQVDIVLKEGTSSLQDVVVIGYGSQSRAEVTTSISKLDNKVLKNVTYSNPSSALQGTVPGVRVQTSSGLPGSTPVVLVRGGTSINSPNSATPLYIVDGVNRPDLNNINKEDIESMQVLKDAASTSIYGALGSNGVVIVTTKSGKSGATRINYSYDLTLSNMTRDFDLLSARDYIYFQRLGIAARGTTDPLQLAKLALPTSGGTGNDLTKNTAFTTQYLTPDNAYKLEEGWESMPDPIDPSKTIIFQDIDWRKILFRTGISHNHNISVSGGTQKATFSATLGYRKDEGIAIFTGYDRLSLNMNGDLQVKDNIKVFGRLMYTNSSFANTISFAGAIPIPNTTKYKFEDGTLAPGNAKSQGNVEYQRSRENSDNRIENLTMVVGMNWDLLPGLSFNPQVSMYSMRTDSRFFQESYFNTTTQFINSRDANASALRLWQKQADAVFSYNKLFGHVHNIDAKLGFSYFDRENSSLSASGRGASTDLIPTLNAAAQPVAVSSAISNRNIQGYFMRVNYDYDQKYLVSLNGRYDGASNLGENNKWGSFPGVSVGWNMHKEKFWDKVPDVISQLKLRASYGVNGNIGALGDYQAQGEYRAGLLYGGIAAIQNTVMANPGLKWEQSKTFDVGMDLGLWGGRVSVLFDYYRRVTDNLLTNLNLPHSSGFTSILSNLGSLQNKGIELELAARPLSPASKIQWNVSFNASKVNTKILKLPANGVENNRVGGEYIWNAAKGDYSWQGGLQEGGRIGDLFAYQQLGVYSTDEEAAKGPLDMLLPGTDKTKLGGDVIFLDADNNGIIDSRDRVYVGNPYPVWTGGFTNYLSYKNFGLTVRTDFATGYTIFNYWAGAQIAQLGGELGLSKDLLRSWQKPGDVTDIPKYYWADQQARNNINRGNSKYYVPGDYLCIREVTLSYELPAKFLNKYKISGLRFNVTGNNLYYFSKLKIMNPEIDVALGNTYPIPRNIIFGANISF